METKVITRHDNMYKNISLIHKQFRVNYAQNNIIFFLNKNKFGSLEIKRTI